MHLTLKFVLVCLIVSSVRTYTLYKWILDSKMRFNYDPDPRNALGVSNWPITYREKCGGIHQSPVNIQTDQVRYGVACGCPNMVYKETVLHGELKNNGHSTTFEPDSEMVIKMSNIPYREGTYYFNDFHLHYGGVSGRNFELQGLRFRGSGRMSAGSEHTIDGLRYEGELHFVFYNAKYGSLEMAEKEKDGVAIIVLMVQKVPDMMVEDMKFSKFLEKNIPYVSPYLANVSTTVDISMFFNRACEFYTYTGSTTTPVCHESVRWMILKDSLQVTEKAWFLLTSLRSRGDFNSRFGNYRTTQPLNDRVVEANFRREDVPALPMPDGEIIANLQRNDSMSPLMIPFGSAERLVNFQSQPMTFSTSGVNEHNRMIDRNIHRERNEQLRSIIQGTAAHSASNFPAFQMTDHSNAVQMSRRMFETPVSMQMIRAPANIMEPGHVSMNSFISPMDMSFSGSVHVPESIRGFDQRIDIQTAYPSINSLAGAPMQGMELRGIQLPGVLFQRPPIQNTRVPLSSDIVNRQSQSTNHGQLDLFVPRTHQATSSLEMKRMDQVSYPPTRFMTSQRNNPVTRNTNNNYIDGWMMYLKHMMSKQNRSTRPF